MFQPLYVSDLLFGKGVAHDILSQRFLADLVISGDAVSCVNAEPAVVPVHELLDEIVSYPALAFQHSQNPGPEDLPSCFISHLGVLSRFFGKGRQ